MSRSMCKNFRHLTPGLRCVSSHAIWVCQIDMAGNLPISAGGDVRNRKIISLPGTSRRDFRCCRVLRGIVVRRGMLKTPTPAERPLVLRRYRGVPVAGLASSYPAGWVRRVTHRQGFQDSGGWWGHARCGVRCFSAVRSGIRYSVRPARGIRRQCCRLSASPSSRRLQIPAPPGIRRFRAG